jgi:alanyl-tRNA synthetase
MSLVDEQHEWGAARVRQTFLDYFKKNGHTFGASQCCTAYTHHD